MVLGCLCDSLDRVVDALASAQQECVKAEEAVAKIAKSMILIAYIHKYYFRIRNTHAQSFDMMTLAFSPFLRFAMMIPL